MKTKRKSALSFLLALIMILSLSAGAAVPAKAAGIDEAWERITQGMLGWQKEIDLTSCSVTKAEFESSIWPQIVSRNPDLFYVWDITYYTDQADNVTKITVTYNSNYNEDSVREYQAALDRAYYEVIRTEMTDVQKALALHDYLVQHVEYDQAGVNAGTEKRNAYEALVNGIGVCEGYTLAYAALLKKAGIESGYCESRTMNHIWNYVKLNGNWYHVDVTWDDTSTGREGLVSHKYFLNSTDQLCLDGKHHHLDGTTECTDTTYDNAYWQAGDVSAVFPVNNKEYFIRARKDTQGRYVNGIDLVERTGASETVIEHYDAVWGFNGTFWIDIPMISLSYYGGVLYFHDAENLYAFNPETDAEPSIVYTYDGGDGVIGSSFVCNREIRLTIDQPGGRVKQHTVPLPGAPSKTEQKLAFAETSLVRNMGDVPFTNPLERTADGGAVTYRSNNPAVASVDENGQVTIHAAGQAVITASAAETTGYLPASASYTITVKQPEPEHTHSYGTAWNSDADNHWHECACGERTDLAAHTFQWIIDQEASSDQAGSKHEECSVCGYGKAPVSIPATGSGQPGNPGSSGQGNGSGQPGNAGSSGQGTGSGQPGNAGSSGQGTGSGQPGNAGSSGQGTGSGTPGAPQTSDNSRPAFWLTLFLLAGTASVGIRLHIRKHTFGR